MEIFMNLLRPPGLKEALFSTSYTPLDNSPIDPTACNSALISSSPLSAEAFLSLFDGFHKPIFEDKFGTKSSSSQDPKHANAPIMPSVGNNQVVRNLPAPQCVEAHLSMVEVDKIQGDSQRHADYDPYELFPRINEQSPATIKGTQINRSNMQQSAADSMCAHILLAPQHVESYLAMVDDKRIDNQRSLEGEDQAHASPKVNTARNQGQKIHDAITISAILHGQAATNSEDLQDKGPISQGEINILAANQLAKASPLPAMNGATIQELGNLQFFLKEDDVQGCIFFFSAVESPQVKQRLIHARQASREPFASDLSTEVTGPTTKQGAKGELEGPRYRGNGEFLCLKQSPTAETLRGRCHEAKETLQSPAPDYQYGGQIVKSSCASNHQETSLFSDSCHSAILCAYLSTEQMSIKVADLAAIPLNRDQHAQQTIVINEILMLLQSRMLDISLKDPIPTADYSEKIQAIRTNPYQNLCNVFVLLLFPLRGSNGDTQARKKHYAAHFIQILIQVKPLARVKKKSELLLFLMMKAVIDPG